LNKGDQQQLANQTQIIKGSDFVSHHKLNQTQKLAPHGAPSIQNPQQIQTYQMMPNPQRKATQQTGPGGTPVNRNSSNKQFKVAPANKPSQA
jgi:hypothetical protein